MHSLLNKIRRYEFSLVRKYFCPGVRVLEVGGGNGYQASLIAECGTIVYSIDIKEPPSGYKKYYPVQVYDGKRFPFQKDQFDIIFSSNVLEHIPVKDLPNFFEEMKRVMKDDAIAIHVLPTPAWRFWTYLAYYPNIAKRMLRMDRDLMRKLKTLKVDSNLTCSKNSRNQSSQSIIKILIRKLLQEPHGEYPSPISELYYFSRYRWSNVFLENGFEIINELPSNIFYTGYSLFPIMSINYRCKLSKLFGSATRVFILKKVK